jgi:hypothetical protein
MTKITRLLRGLPIVGLSMMVVLAAVCPAQQNSPEPSQRKTDQASTTELQRRADQASGAECAQLSMRAARRTLEDADHLFGDGSTQAAHAAIDVSLHYAQRSVECTVQSRKRRKAAEIELRGFIRRMNDVARTLDSEDRQHLTEVLAELERQRDRLLQSIFGAAAANSREDAQ